MKVAGIIAEYNPFHKGHQYHIEETRKQTGADYVIAVMSGDYVQRGEPAIADKYMRTRMALSGGADLVIEMPVIYATASAEYFATAGIGILDRLGCVDYLSFGSEWADVEDYSSYATLFLEEPEEYRQILQEQLKRGKSFPEARAFTAGKLLFDSKPETAVEFLKEPNHILGLEYIKSIIDIFSGIFDVFVSIIVSVYILLQRTTIINALRRFVRAIFKKETYETIDKYFTKANQVFFTFISSQLLDAVIVGILTTIAMMILKVKYAPLIGFTIGLFNMIPYIGAIVAVSIGILVTFITGGFGKALAMAVVVIILQQIDANIINPKIIGSSLEISPLLVIFSITVGGAYFGILGMFLAVPIAVVLKIGLTDFVDARNKIKDEEESRNEG